MATVDSKLGFFSLVSVPRSDWPGGCARGSYTGNEGDDGFLWNPLSAGAASPGKQLLCIGMHASPHGRPAGVCSMCTCACVSVVCASACRRTRCRMQRRRRRCKKHARRREGAIACVRARAVLASSSACCFVTVVHTHCQPAAPPRMQPSRRAHISHISRMRLCRPNQRDGAHVQPSGRYGPLASAAAARGAGVSTVAARQLFLCFAAIRLWNVPCPYQSAELTEAACQSLAAIAGKRYAGSVASGVFPTRCYWNTITDVVYYNPDPDVGEPGAKSNVYAFVQSICVGAPTSRRTASECAGGWQRAACGSAHDTHGVLRVHILILGCIHNQLLIVGLHG
jgi:hypothetical protein